MENIAFDIWLSERMQFSSADKKECFETAKKMVVIAMNVEKNGSSAFEELKSSNDTFLEIAVKLAVDGFDSERIRIILQNYIISGNYKGRELLRRILITESVMMIVGKYEYQQICEELASYFGEDNFREYMNYCKDLF